VSGGERILVTGATGYLARRLVPRLRARGHAVRALVRGGFERASRDPAARHLDGCEIAAGDVTDAASCRAAAAGCTAIVHLVGIIKEQGRSTFERVHVGGTRAVVDAARAAGTRRVLYVSAIGARPNGPSAYWRTKGEAEEIVRASGLEWLVLRPSIVLARDGEFFGVLRTLTAFPVVPILGPGTSRIAPILADDLAEIQARAFERPSTWNRVHEVCGPSAPTFDGLIRMAARGRGRRVVLVHVPLALARPLVALAARIVPFAPITPDQLAMLNEDSTCDGGAIEAAFGFRPGPIEPVFDDAGRAKEAA
jgi:NADH dehydrogenase